MSIKIPEDLKCPQCKGNNFCPDPSSYFKVSIDGWGCLDCQNPRRRTSLLREALEKYAWSYDEEGRLALIGKKDFDRVENEILKTIENALKNSGGWNLSVLEAFLNLKGTP